MRGEHCIAGASVLSAIAIILLIFANLGQISTGALVSGIYFAQVNTAPYGAALVAKTKSSADGLYDTKNEALGKGLGLRQNYRFGIYKACGYQKDGSGICTNTVFGNPMEPYNTMFTDLPIKYRDTLSPIVPASTFKDDGYNRSMTRAGGLLVFVGSALAALSLVFGVIRSRIFFLVAAACSGASAFFLLIGVTLWTAVIAKDGSVSNFVVTGTQTLGVTTTAGPSLYLTWVAFVLVLLSVLPYGVACCTFRRS